MNYRYRINISDKEEALNKLGKKEGISFEKASKEDNNILFLLVPLKKEEELVLSSDSEIDTSLFLNANENRHKAADKLEKAEKVRVNAHLYALLASFVFLVAIASAFFAVGFGMKRGGGYYALLILTIGFLYLTYLTLKKGATLYADYREKKRCAYALVEEKESEKA